MKKFSWESFKKREIMVKCEGTDVIKHFMKEAESNGIAVAAVKHQLDIGKNLILVCCKVLPILSEQTIYVAEPTPMFTTNDAPWLIDWKNDVIAPTFKRTEEQMLQATPETDSLQAAWRLTRKIAAMTPDDRDDAFGYGCNPLLSMEYAEAKKKYDAWNEKRFCAKDIVYLADGRRAIVIGNPIYRPNGSICHEVLFGDFSTGTYRNTELTKTGKRASGF